MSCINDASCNMSNPDFRTRAYLSQNGQDSRPAECGAQPPSPAERLCQPLLPSSEMEIKK